MITTFASPLQHCAAAELEDVEPSDEAGAALAAQWKGLLAHVQALRPLERFRVASVGYRRCSCAINVHKRCCSACLPIVDITFKT